MFRSKVDNGKEAMKESSKSIIKYMLRVCCKYISKKHFEIEESEDSGLAGIVEPDTNGQAEIDAYRSVASGLGGKGSEGCRARAEQQGSPEVGED